MAITLAPDVLSDAEITDRIGFGDLGSAARLWVRHWPTALGAARQYVEPAEVPGLAAEALIGTIAAIAIGRGPREDVTGFVAAAVRELGEDDEQTPRAPAPSAHPEVFVSPIMTIAFAELDEQTQRSLHDIALGEPLDADRTRALTVLQHYYLAEHADRADSQACRRTHVGMMGAVESTNDGLAGDAWLHLSTCAWCTEAFHEIAFSSIALGDLVDGAVLDRVPPPPVTTFSAAAPSADLVPLGVAAQSMPQPEPVEAPVPPEPPFEEPAAAATFAGFLRGAGRGRLVAGAIATGAAAAVIAVLLSGMGGDGNSPAAAGTDPTETASAGEPSATTSDLGLPAIPTGAASTTITPSSGEPTSTPTASSTPTPTSQTTTKKPASTPTSKATSTPTKKPSSTPTSAPTTATPTPTPTPTPTATPTKSCNALQHLLGLC